MVKILKSRSHYINSSSDYAPYTLKNAILKELKINKGPFNPAIICIGTDRATGDCLGPLVGEFLSNTALKSITFGTMQNPIHAQNLSESVFKIHSEIENPFIIAVDASLGQRNHIGFITFSSSPLKPGIGLNKNLISVGNASITGIVNYSFPNNSSENFRLLQSTRLSLVYKMSKVIALSLILSINEIYTC